MRAGGASHPGSLSSGPPLTLYWPKLVCMSVILPRGMAQVTLSLGHPWDSTWVQLPLRCLAKKLKSKCGSLIKDFI